jgi:hypothetical protein
VAVSFSNTPNTAERPVIAILTVADKQRVFRGDKRNFTDIIRTGEELGAQVYVVTASDLKLAGGQILAYCYQTADKKWNRQLVPQPHVIYNRVPYRKLEMLPEVQQTIQSCLKSRGVQLFNPSFFNKWSLFEWLSRASDTKRFIPVTQQLNGIRKLESFLRKHPTVYLKPVRGKAGKGIMRLDRKSQYEYVLRVQDKRSSQEAIFTSLDALWEQIQETIGTKEYIIQQGISLTSYEDRPYDLRVLVQKNYKGTWSVTGVGARVAGKASITTHVPRGGTIDEPSRLLTSAFGSEEAKRILGRVKQAALSIAGRIEKSSGHPHGEMSMDLGVDTSGRIWFFEANSKPMKFDEPDIRKKSLERIIRYGIYLTKKGTRR